MTPRIEQALEEVRAIYYRSSLLRGGARTLATLCAAILILFIADNAIALPAALRLAGAAAFLAVVGRAFWRDLVRPLARDVPPEACALILEKRHPELDSRLINSLLLRDASGPLVEKVVAVTTREADALVRRFSFPALFDARAIARAALAASALLAALGLYGILFPAYFGNAFIRYADPWGAHGHVLGPALLVTPGSVTLKPGDELAVRATIDGPLPEKADLERDDATFAMTFDGQAFVFRFPPIRGEGFTYRVVTPSAASPRYTVTVAQPPAIAGLTLRYDFPPYSGLPVRFEERSSGEVRCLKGTAVTIAVAADRPLARGFLDGYGKRVALEPRRENVVEGKFEAIAEGAYTIRIVDREHGLEGGADRSYAIRIEPDAPPRVVVVKPSPGARYRPGAPLETIARGTDDLGVAWVSVLVADDERGPFRPVRRWDGEKGKLAVQGELVLYPKKDRLFLKAAARDFLGQEAATDVVALSALSGAEVKETELSQIGNAARSLRRILELQEALVERTRATCRPGGQPERGQVLELRAGQGEIIAAGRELLLVWDKTGLSAAARLRFELLVRADMPDVARRFSDAATAREPRPIVVKTIEAQLAIVAALRSILGELGELALAVKEGDPAKISTLAERADRQKKSLESLRDELARFIEEQKNVIATSEKLAGKRVDDFTAGDLAAAKELAATEEKWAGAIQAKAAEFARLGAQDFSDRTLVSELIEAYSDVDKAAAALAAREIEIAVPLEQSGLELAEELTVNIERWLSDVPDKIKWSMEDPVADVEVPMVDLPRELEDLVGELIDREEEMTEDVEDVTSGWLDSMNEGAGWTAMDGPISNMSAKGVTGNLLPNQNEIGGRSGEGRSGRSHGQMVEDEATGKGGRPTPTRVTPDPFEAGQVKDTGSDPTGGATGGGKLAGAAPEGLRGPPAPDVSEKLRGLAARQSEIRSQAERIDHRLRTLSMNADNLGRAIELMRALEDAVASGEPANIARLHERVVSSLRRQEADIESRAGSRIEGGDLLPQADRGISNAADEAIPAAYESQVRDYFESLTKGGR